MSGGLSSRSLPSQASCYYDQVSSTECLGPAQSVPPLTAFSMPSTLDSGLAMQLPMQQLPNPSDSYQRSLSFFLFHTPLRGSPHLLPGSPFPRHQNELSGNYHLEIRVFEIAQVACIPVAKVPHYKRIMRSHLLCQSWLGAHPYWEESSDAKHGVLTRL